MKKTIIISQVLILFLFFILLGKDLWIEEILLVFLFPIILIFIAIIFMAFIIRIFRKNKFKYAIKFTFLCSSIIQLLLCFYIFGSIHPREFSKKKVSDDIDNAVISMEDIHPNIYAKISKNHLAKIIDSIKISLPENVIDTDLFKVFASITALTNDAHTQLSLDNFLERGSILFRKVPPYSFRIKNDKIYILKNYSLRNNIPIGSEVININNKSASQCLAEISRMVSYETINYRDALLQLPTMWGIWNNFQDFEITFKAPDNSIETIMTSSGFLANLQYLWDFTAGFGTQNYSYKILNGSIGYIDLQAFEDLEKFKIFMNSTFGNIKQDGINDLVIDIRKNSGGLTSVSKELMQYISPVEYTLFDSSLVKISNYLISRSSVDTSIFKPGSIVDEELASVTLNKNPLRFNGNCYVLTSNYCFSTALDFSAMVRCFNAGIIIGQETGGKTISYGSPTKVTLPETGIIIKVSCKKFVNPCASISEKGLIPDQIIENSIEDNIAGFDRVLDYTISLIKSRGK